MRAAGIDEPDDSYAFADLMAHSYKDALPQEFRGKPTKSMVEYGSVGARHLQQLSELADQSDEYLRRYVFEIARAIGMEEKETMNKLRKLLSTHAEEWKDFVCAQGPNSFLKNWTKGGRHG